MIVKDKALLKEFAAKPVCERCGGKSRGALHPHHLFCRGMGGGSRLDIRINVLALCPACHGAFHDGNIPRGELVRVVADREKVDPSYIEVEVYRILRLPKGSSLG